MPRRHRRLAWPVLAGLALLSPAAAPAQTGAAWPDRPVTVIHNYGPGTASDATARAVAEAFSARFGQPFPVVNRDGAAGVVGTRALAASPPDGTTILVGPLTALTAQPHVVRDTGLGPEAVAPVCNLTVNMLGAVVRADSSIRTGQDLVAAARRGPLNFGSSGRLSLSALGVHRMQAATGGEFVSVGFRSDGAALTEVMAGRLDFGAVFLGNATPQIRDGTLRLIGVFADRRYPEFPQVPTFPEQGIPAVQMSYAGVLAPRGTPEPILARLEEACAASMSSPPFLRAVERYALIPDHRGRAEFAALLRREHEELGAVMRALGVRPE
jgi:tripartite-type tricarboxylate transporter receptor subunit TctC